MSTHGGGPSDRFSGERLGGLKRYSIHTELEFPWMKNFAKEVDKIEERKKLIKDLFEEDPLRYGFLVAEFMDGVLVPLQWKLNNLVSKNDVWSRESVVSVYRLTAKACQLLLYPVRRVPEICSLAKVILQDYENQKGRVVELQEMVKNWVTYGVDGIPSSR
ncbi:hypothetical protein ACHQM5_025166 [Ranunculus cassubicifolius]